MRAVVQRVSRARVSVSGASVAEIEPGLLVLLGVATTDTSDDAERLAAKLAALRIFEDADGKMNLDVAEIGGKVLCISQFTLYGDTRRGNRPSFTDAAPGPFAEPLYLEFCSAIERAGIECKRGVFGAEMAVELVNDGPVTLVIDTGDLARSRRA